ncbi:MAG: phycobiliprotein lyase, partial [Cyanobacteria bacterium J06628_6]
TARLRHPFRNAPPPAQFRHSHALATADPDGLLLTTEYETMSSVERFWFATPDLRMRTSIVKRFGGFNTASFCAESRIKAARIGKSEDYSNDQAVQDFDRASQYAAFGW